MLLVGVMAFLVVGAVVLGSVGEVFGRAGGDQQAADLGALAAAKRMAAVYARVYEPTTVAGHANPQALSRAAYLALGRDEAAGAARANGAAEVSVWFPASSNDIAPTQVSVRVHSATATAELIPGGGDLTGIGGQNQYNGPFAFRQGKPMRPDVALAFDRMQVAALDAGVSLIIGSAFRSDAEQARLFAQHPDPKWVAPPGKSLHRLGTELDLGPAGAYGWLQRNASRFHFVQRYSWEPWHYGYTLNARSTPDSQRDRWPGDGATALPSFVPVAYQETIARSASRWNLSAALLSAQLYVESNFNPFAVSGAGARGIAQFMPGTARAYGLDDPYDPERSIGAQARLMRDLLRQFGSVSLALAAYNAGPAPVERCGCVPPIPETQAYVAKILGLMGGSLALPPAAGLEVRLVS
jgi:hypothetical protein